MVWKYIFSHRKMNIMHYKFLENLQNSMNIQQNLILKNNSICIDVGCSKAVNRAYLWVVIQLFFYFFLYFKFFPYLVYMACQIKWFYKGTSTILTTLLNEII